MHEALENALHANVIHPDYAYRPRFFDNDKLPEGYEEVTLAAAPTVGWFQGSGVLFRRRKKDRPAHVEVGTEAADELMAHIAHRWELHPDYTYAVFERRYSEWPNEANLTLGQLMTQGTADYVAQGWTPNTAKQCGGITHDSFDMQFYLYKKTPPT